MPVNCPECNQEAQYDEGTQNVANAHFCSDCMIWRNVGETRWRAGMEDD